MGVDVAQENRCFSIIPGGHYLSMFNIICLRNLLKTSCTLFWHSSAEDIYWYLNRPWFLIVNAHDCNINLFWPANNLKSYQDIMFSKLQVLYTPCLKTLKTKALTLWLTLSGTSDWGSCSHIGQCPSADFQQLCPPCVRCSQSCSWRIRFFLSNSSVSKSDRSLK